MPVWKIDPRDAIDMCNVRAAGNKQLHGLIQSSTFEDRRHSRVCDVTFFSEIIAESGDVPLEIFRDVG